MFVVVLMILVSLNNVKDGYESFQALILIDSSSTRQKPNSSGLAKCTSESIVINRSSILSSKTVRNLRSHPGSVFSRLDYCNGLLAKALDYLLAQLSGVMRAAAKLILQLPRKSHISDAIRDQLHWLDISEHVCFKLCVLARRCIHGSAPLYLSRYCIPVSSIAGRSHLCSAAFGDLFIPATNTVTIGPRSFAVACPATWNSLPPELHDKSLSLMTFRKKLKTYLFKTN